MTAYENRLKFNDDLHSDGDGPDQEETKFEKEDDESETISQLKERPQVTAASDGRKRRVSEPRIRVRQLFNSIQDALTPRKLERQNSNPADQPSAVSNTPIKKTSSPSSAKKLNVPIIGRRHSVFATTSQQPRDSITQSNSFSSALSAAAADASTLESKMSQQEKRNYFLRQGKAKRRVSQVSGDLKLTEGSETDDRIAKESDQEENKTNIHARSQDRSEMPSTSGGSVYAKERHMLHFLRLHNKDSTSRSQKPGQSATHAASVDYYEIISDKADTSSNSGNNAMRNPLLRSPVASKDASENNSASLKRDQVIGSDRQKFSLQMEKLSKRQGKPTGEGAAVVRAFPTRTEKQPEEVKPKEKSVLRSLFGRMRSVSVSHENKVQVDLHYKDQFTGNPSDAASEDDGDWTQQGAVSETPPTKTTTKSKVHWSQPKPTRPVPPPRQRLRDNTESKPNDALSSYHRQRSISMSQLTETSAPVVVDVNDILTMTTTTTAAATTTAGLKDTIAGPSFIVDAAAASPMPMLRSISREDRRRKALSMPDLLNLPEAEIDKFRVTRELIVDHLVDDDQNLAEAKQMSDAASRTAAGDHESDVIYQKKRRPTLSEIQALAVNVFNRKSQNNPSRSLMKLLDPKKDILSRLKHLRLISESYDVNKLKQFYTENYSYIYYLFHEGFTTTEILLSAKASRTTQREDLDLVLVLLEKILCILPELVKKRWQCHSLGQIMLKLLRCSTFYKDGMKLFLNWYCILMENATTLSDQIFESLVPVSDVGSDFMHNSSTVSSCLEWMLNFMVTETSKVLWNCHQTSFEFLFKRFFQCYVHHIFPDFNVSNIYSTQLDIPHTFVANQTLVSDRHHLALQEVIVKWVAEFMESNDSDIQAEMISFDIVPEKVLIEDKLESSTSLSRGLKKFKKKDYEMVCSVFYQSKDNIGIILEILHQALLVSLYQSHTAKLVVSVYRHWFKCKKKPCFMDELMDTPVAGDRNSLMISQNGHRRSGSSSSCQSSTEVSDVAVGLQRTLQIFITQSVIVFMKDWKNIKLNSAPGHQVLLEQVDLCKSTLSVYRYVAMNVHMTRQTWMFLMTALLRITSHIMDSAVPKQKMTSLAAQLASVLLRTLIVTWIRANLNIGVSKDLWNQLLSVLSSITEWPEVIQEWAEALEILTAVLANAVYNVDIKSLNAVQVKDQKKRIIKKRNFSADLAGEVSGDQLQRDDSIGSNNKHPVLSHHMSIAPAGVLHQDRKTDSELVELPPIPMLRMPRKDSVAGQNLVRSASDNNIFSSSSTVHKSSEQLPCERPFSEGRPARLKSLESLLTRNKNDDNDFNSWNKPLSVGDDTNSVDRYRGEDDRTDTLKAVKCVTRSYSTSAVDCDNQAEAAAGDRISMNSAFGEDNSYPTYTFQSQFNYSSSPKTDDSLLQSGEFFRPYGKPDVPMRTRRSASRTNSNDLDSRNSTAATTSISSSIMEDRASIASTESFSSDWYTSINSEATAESFLCSGAYDTRSMQSSGAEKFMSSGNESPGHDESPGFHRMGGHPLQFFEDLQTVFLEPETEKLLLADLRQDTITNSNQSLKHGTAGWTPEVAALMWRRVLGLLGDVNSIEDAESHATVFNYLCNLTETLLKVQNSMKLQKMYQTTAPIFTIMPWVFQALTLSDKYMKGKVLAYKLLCLIILQPVIEIPVKLLIRFYLILHQGLLNSNNDIVSALIKHCASQFFVSPLSGATILLLDFIHAATGVVTVSMGQMLSPTYEAVCLLGSLICFPNHFGQMSVLTPDVVISVTSMSVSNVYVKDCIINVLLSNSASKDTLQLTSCIRICGLGIYAYEELSHGTLHSKVQDAIVGVIDSVKDSSDQTVKLLSLDILVLLTDHSQILMTKFPDLPRTIIEELVNYAEACLRSLSRPFNFKVLTNTLFCILSWSMSIPVAELISLASSPRFENDCLLNRIFTILEMNFFESSAGANDPAIVDHNSNYQVLSTTAKKGPERPARISLRSLIRELLPVTATIRKHLLNYLGQCPLGHRGMSKLDSEVIECHDISEQESLTMDILSQQNVQFLVWNDSFLISLNELPLEIIDSHALPVMSLGSCRVIIRDISGKYCYDLLSSSDVSNQCNSLISESCMTNDNQPDILSSSKASDEINNKTQSTSICTKSTDLIDAILEEISLTSPECRLNDGQSLTSVCLPAKSLTFMIEEIMLNCIKEQKEVENEYLLTVASFASRCKSQPVLPPKIEQDANWPFRACRQFISQMGYLTTENRNKIDLLKKSEQLIRDIRHLDNLICRETHKIAVIYVAEGQEDKSSILSNDHGSPGYEEFIAALGWKVTLESHAGYMGGLQRNKTNGETAVYFANSVAEIMFHVSTIMPSSMDTDSLQKKVRHLGNDEVHIVWSDHHRRYHRNILNTEFADVIIVIYPLQSGLFHIQIVKKPEVGFFGPLFDGAIINSLILPGLVRATALNASRTIRAQKQHYRPYYDERDSCLRNIIEKHSRLTSREDFISEILCPGNRGSATDVKRTVQPQGRT